MAYYPAAGKTYTLGASIGSTDTTIRLSSFVLPVSGTAITMAILNTAIAYGTIAPKTNSAEFISFTGITQNADGTATLTGVTRGLSKVHPFTASATYRLPHSGQSVFILSDAPQVFNEYGALKNANTWDAINTFSVSPIVPTPAAATEAANKAYVDNGVLAGGADMSTTVKGVGRTATSPNKTLGNPTITIASPAVITLNSHGLTANDTVQFTTTGALPTGIAASTTYYVISTGLTANDFRIAATLGGAAINTSGSQSGTHTLVRTTPYVVNDQDTRLPTQGENDAMVGNNTDIAVGPTNKFVTQTGLQKNAESYAVDGSASSTAYTATLSPVPISLVAGQEICVKIGLANTTTNPTLNVNGLGAKTIVKGLSTALSVGDIVANQICTFRYDGTNMVLQNPATLTGTKIYVTTTNVAIASSVAETTLITTTLPGGVLGTNNAVRTVLYFSALNVSGTANSVTFRYKYGATTVITRTLSTNATQGAGTNYSGKVEFVLHASGATNSQEGAEVITFGSSGNVIGNAASNVSGYPILVSESVGTAAEISTGDLTLAVTAQFSNSGVNDNLTMTSAVVEKIIV